jgi:hypothetical protein
MRCIRGEKTKANAIKEMYLENCGDERQVKAGENTVTGGKEDEITCSASSQRKSTEPAPKKQKSPTRLSSSYEDNDSAVTYFHGELDEVDAAAMVPK